MTTLSSREGESTTPLYIIQHRANHGSVNIQGAERTVRLVTDAFGKTSGTRIIYAESFGGTDKEATEDRRLVRSRGPLFYFASRLVGSTEENRVRTRMQDFSTFSDQQLVDADMVGYSNVGRFFLFRGLQRLQDGGVDFDHAFEGHTPQTLRKLNTQQTDLNRFARMGVNAWYSGNFNAGISAHRSYFEGRLKLQVAREPEMHSQLRGLVSEIQNDPNGGVLFINAGFTHEELMDRLRQFKFKPGVSPVFEDHLGVPDDIPELLIDHALRKGQRVDNILYARDLLLKRGLERIVNDTIQRGRTYALGRSFESVTNTVVKIVNGLSIEDIRRHCEQREGFMTFIRQFPSAGFIFPLLS